MILDVTRHKFYEGLITLLIFATATVAAVWMSYGDVTTEAEVATPPLGMLINRFTVTYPTLAKIAILPLMVYAVLRLSRATARVSLYPQGTLAAIALASVTLFAVIPAEEYATLTVVALLLSEAIGRLIYCFGPNVRAHYLFTAMLALGMLPLVDGSLVILTALIPTLTILLRGTIRETVITIVGTITPIFVCCYVLWLSGNSFAAPMETIRDSISIHSSEPFLAYLTLPRLIFVGTLLFLQLSSTILYFSNRTLISGNGRNIWFILQLSLVALVASLVVLGATTPAMVVAAAIVITPMIPMFFVCVSPFISVTTYIVVIIAAFVAQL